MELFVKNKKGKFTRILGLEAQLVCGLLFLGAGALGVLWAYANEVADLLISVLPK